MGKAILYVACFIVFITLYSCNAIMYNFYGIKKLEVFDDSLYYRSLNSMVRDFHEPYYSIVSSEDEFANYHSSFNGLGDKNIKQPVQILYFKADSLVSFRANCHARGNIFGDLDWNYDGDFDQFVPRSAIELGTGIPSLKTLSEIYRIPKENKADVTVLFFWNNMLLKQSKSAFEAIVDNYRTHSGESGDISIVLVNTDKPYIDFFKNE